MTDFRARGTIMGPAGLTAVFGMGTGVTPPVWSPEKPPAGCHATPEAIPLGFRSSITRQSIKRVASQHTLGKFYTSTTLTFGSVNPPWISRLRLQYRGSADRGGQVAWLLGRAG